MISSNTSVYFCRIFSIGLSGYRLLGLDLIWWGCVHVRTLGTFILSSSNTQMCTQTHTHTCMHKHTHHAHTMHTHTRHIHAPTQTHTHNTHTHTYTHMHTHVCTCTHTIHTHTSCSTSSCRSWDATLLWFSEEEAHHMREIGTDSSGWSGNRQLEHQLLCLSYIHVDKALTDTCTHTHARTHRSRCMHVL